MNTRIREIMDQALDGIRVVDEIEDQHFEKFAELIIRECTNEIHASDLGDLAGSSYYLDKVAEHIENHFGVK